MMNTLDRGCVEDFVQPAQLRDPFRMHPVLILRDKHQPDDSLKWIETNQDHWDQERPFKKAFDQAQPETDGKIVVVRAVMDVVVGPKDAVFMLKTMHPIVGKIRYQ